MKVELFTLCEGAFNTNGRLTIVNTFEDIVSNQYPWRSQLGMALKLGFLKDEMGEYDIKVSILPESGGQPMHEISAHLSYKQSVQASDVHLAMATNIQGVVIPAAGIYKVDIRINDNLLQSFPFKAILKNV